MTLKRKRQYSLVVQFMRRYVLLFIHIFQTQYHENIQKIHAQSLGLHIVSKMAFSPTD